MSVQAIAWALSQQIVKQQAARHVLLCLANYAGEDGKNAFPSVARLVAETGLSERAVRNNLRELEEMGVLRRGNQAIAAAFIERADRRPVVYDIALERGAVNAAREETGCTEEANGVHEKTERGAGGAPDPSSKPSIEPSEDSSSEEISEALNEYQLLAETIGLSKVAKLSDKRRSHLRARIREHGLETWRAAMRAVGESDFLSGRRGGGVWRPDFDWFVNPNNFLKLIEGKYHDGKAITGRPARAESEEDQIHIRHLQSFDRGVWIPGWGGAPGEPDCRIPAHILARYRAGEFRGAQ